VLAAAPADPVGYNNLGNVLMGLGRFDEALASLDQAVALGGADYAFAAANHALAQFERGRTNLSVTELRSLLRRFPVRSLSLSLSLSHSLSLSVSLSLFLSLSYRYGGSPPAGSAC
jgi:tetratricopeptide (TPR) repeat protein